MVTVKNLYLFTKSNSKKALKGNLQGFLNREPDNVLLSLEIQPTIIGAKMFHCPVRNGKEWDHLAMVVWLSLLIWRIISQIEFLVVNEAFTVCVCFLTLGFSSNLSEQQAVRL